MKTIRIGIIGCGMIASVGHLPCFARNPHCTITAVADPDKRNLASARRKYKVPHGYDDPEDLLGSRHLDAVVICSPNWAHADQVSLAAENGLHVLCEKPMGTTMAECESMIRACSRAGTVLQVAMQKRFHPAFQRAREMIDSGELGEVFQITVLWSHYIPDLDVAWIRKPLKGMKKLGIDLEKKWGSWRLTDARAGGGDFMDHGPHYLDLFRFLLGDYNLVSAEMKRLFSSRVHEDHALCTVRFDCGALGHIERSQNVVSRPYGHEEGMVHGSRGSLYFDIPHEYTLSHAKLYRYRKRNAILDRRTRIHLPGGTGKLSYQRQADLFVSRILKREPEKGGFPEKWAPDGEDGRIAVESVLAAYLSSREERKIPFPLSQEDRSAVESLQG